MNRGIRRRLAPLMDNDRRKIELMNSLLMSLPGSTLRRHVAPGAAPLLGRCRGRRPSPPPLDCAIP